MEEVEYLRHVFPFEFNRGAKATGVVRNIYDVYGRKHCKEMVFSFKEVYFDVRDASRSEKTLKCDEDRLKALNHNNMRQ